VFLHGVLLSIFFGYSLIREKSEKTALQMRILSSTRTSDITTTKIKESLGLRNKRKTKRDARRRTNNRMAIFRLDCFKSSFLLDFRPSFFVVRSWKSMAGKALLYKKSSLHYKSL
jgi:hypothetical protein